MKTLGVTYVKPKEPEEPEVVLSVDENLSNNFKLFPNPSTGSVKLQYSTGVKVKSIQVFYLQGMEVANLIINALDPNTLDINGLGAGVYVIHIQTDNGLVSKKVIVQ